MIEIREVVGNKKQFLSLLLLADEQEDMIDRYIADGTMYVLDDNGVKGECVVLNVALFVLISYQIFLLTIMLTQYMRMEYN